MNKLKKNILALTLAALLLLSICAYLAKNGFTLDKSKNPDQSTSNLKQVIAQTDPLQISEMRKRSYPGSDITIGETLTPKKNYNQYIASYKSDGLKIYGLLTVPQGDPPAGGWPAIIFNHGYIPPDQYQTTERYVAYVASFAQARYVVFKPDFRGNGNSEGQPEGSYYSPGYTIDALNALSSIKKYPNVNGNKIGMWGHSMGGNVTLRSLVVSQDIKAAVIWGGVVGTYDDLLNNWSRKVSYVPSQRELSLRNTNRANLLSKHGTPQTEPDFWHSIDPNYNLQYVQTPVQLNAGLADEEVPWQFSQELSDRLKTAGKTVEFYAYPGADHNISVPSFDLAMKNSLNFFNKYLKGGD